MGPRTPGAARRRGCTPRTAGDRDALLGVGHDQAYDIEDPIGGGLADYEVTADELDELLGRLVALAWPSVTAPQQERSA